MVQVLEPHDASIEASATTGTDDDMTVYSYASSAASAHMTPLAASFSISPTGNFGPAFLQAGTDWQSSGQSPIYSSDESAPTAVNSSLTPFNFLHEYGNEIHQHGEQAVLFSNGYVASPIATPHLAHSYTWDMVNPTSLQPEVGGFHHIGSGGRSGTTALELPSAGHSAASYPDQPREGATEYSEPGVGLNASSLLLSDTNETTKGRLQSKRPKTASRKKPSTSASNHANTKGAALPSLASATVAGSSRGSTRPSAGSKTRSTTRASNTTTNAADKASQVLEIPEDKKTKGSHNLVEKQYRNRLNAQFDGLMSALPDTLKSQGGALELGEVPNSEVADRRISKAEVLDMARMHIQHLEQERDLLAHEQNELRETIEKIKEECAREESAQGDMDDG